MPCGGTHLTDLTELTEIMVSMDPTEDGFVMRTFSISTASQRD
jgi:Ser-tRNA(Ala) deacylase AlaX